MGTSLQHTWFGERKGTGPSSSSVGNVGQWGTWVNARSELLPSTVVVSLVMFYCKSMLEDGVICQIVGRRAREVDERGVGEIYVLGVWRWGWTAFCEVSYLYQAVLASADAVDGSNAFFKR